ncbi:hypothetical protein [Streptomyces sp. NPDC047042]|uniref:hypothetical protein n=1 Tax=Streptomyces sp. NPDC047042 TaxID=3154807 RepID=UPI0033CC4385
MHFAVAGREHELALNRVRDYADTPGGLTANLRVSKVRPRIVPVPYGSRSPFSSTTSTASSSCRCSTT